MVGFFHISTHLGGAERSFLDLARELKALKKNYIVLLPKSTGPLVDELNKSAIPWKSLAIPPWFLKTSRKNIFSLLLLSPLIALYSLVFLFKLNGLLKKHQITTIHSTGLKMQMLTGIHGRLFGTVVVLHIRDIINNVLIRRTFSWMDGSSNIHFLANSQLTADSLHPIQAEVVYNGFTSPLSTKASPLKEQLGIPHDQFLVGIVGAIARWKGQKEFIEMAKVLLDKYPEMHFVIIGSEIYDTKGESGQLNQLKEQVRKEGTLNNIHFLPFQNQMDLIYPGLDALVHGSIEPEPFGRVIVEAMFHEKPLTASAAGGPLEIIDEGVNGLLHSPGDVQQMAANIEKIYLNPELKNSLGKKARLRAEQFSMGRHCLKMCHQLGLSTPDSRDHSSL